MFENLDYIEGFTATYSTELAAIEAAAERASAQVEGERSRLLRSDGQPVYGPQEHQERLGAILEAAGARYDEQTARYVARSEEQAADLERKLAALAGADPFDTLSEAEQQRASVRREFVREDFAALDSPDPERQAMARTTIADRARAALASGDRAASYLYYRYSRGRPDLADVLSELEGLFVPADRFERRRDLEAKRRAAKALPVAVEAARRTFDGSLDRLMAGMATGRM